MHGMIDAGGDADQTAVEIAGFEGVEFAERRRIDAAVEQDQPEAAGSEKYAVVLFAVDDPSFRIAGENGGLVDVNEGSVVKIPGGVEDFAESASLTR